MLSKSRNFNSVLCSLATLVLISCNSDRIYEGHVDPPGNLLWAKSDPIMIDIEIVDTSIKYNEYIAFRHATGYSFSACSLKIVESDPDGVVKEYLHTMKTADSQGYLSDCAGDICDLEELWMEERKFGLPGTYRYQISHEMSRDTLHFVMEVGMMVEMAKTAHVR